MGCWDIFCFLCGNPCHKSFENKDAILESIQFYETYKKNDRFKKSLKPIYDAYIKNPENYLQKIHILNKSTKWLTWVNFC